MKLWVDDVRPAPNMYVWLKSVDEAKECIEFLEEQLARVREELRPYSGNNIEIIDIDHDAGDYGRFGGDYIKLLDWLEETGRNCPIRIHSMNPVGVENMPNESIDLVVTDPPYLMDFVSHRRKDLYAPIVGDNLGGQS